MREITSHVVNPANDKLKLTVIDEPGHGGACHHYAIIGFDTQSNVAVQDEPPFQGLTVLFQNGPIAEVGVNGITHEVLLAILIDRLEGFQRGPYASDHNAAALHHLQSAAGVLHDRTRERINRGVEGTHKL